MYRACKFRLYPTSVRQAALAKSFGCCRWYWNYSLNLCQETYKLSGKSLSRGAIQGLLPKLKKELEWLSDALFAMLAVCSTQFIYSLQEFL